ncbi:hypothetical protein EKD04_014975 [Chloroflexales bacterium ZM16-3]|nr:hypothetical protein [Chloroflexales bacterium ZM16-3]
MIAQVGCPPTQGTGESLARDYRQRRLTDFVIAALESVGRNAEIIPLCEREVTADGGYQRLVKRLLTAGRSAEAEQWARTGIAAAERPYPGIAHQLREVVCGLRAHAGDWAMVAALRAEEFFDQPSAEAFQTLAAAAAQADAQPAVRVAALH